MSYGKNPSVFIPSFFIPSFFIPSFFIPSFFIPSFFIPSFFIPSFSGGGVTYKPTLIKEQAHVNAQNILMENGERLVQYDNLSVDQKAQIGERFPDYATPNKNHELVDYVKVDRNGNVISNTLTQSKFVGKDGAEYFEKFLSKDL
ncbi:hypothetical protein BD0112_02620 [Helicobacter pylori]